jgi:Tol biopolymer transport system component
LLIAGLQAGETFSLSRDGKLLLYTRELNYSNLWLFDVDSRGRLIDRTQLTAGTSLKTTPSFSPDGKWIAFSIGDARSSNIFTLPAAGGEPKQLTFFAAQSASPAWSPDGREIAFASKEGGNPRVWRVRADGGTPRPFKATRLLDAFNQPSYELLTWAPGSKILYARPGDRNFGSLDPRTEEETALVPNDSVGFLAAPQYSPDGKAIAVRWLRLPTNEANLDPPPGVWILGTENASQTLLTEEDLWPIRWASDGNWIFALHNDNRRIFKVSARDGEPKLLLTADKPILWASVTNDGRRIVAALQEVQSDLWITENFDSDLE